MEEEEAPRGECEEWRTWCAVGGWKAGCCCRVDRCVVVSAVARVRAGVVARVVVDIAVALARARDMFALMFAEAVDGGGIGWVVDGLNGSARLVTGLQLERTLYFSAEVGLGDVVVLFLYTNLHCTCENMLFCRAMATLASAHRLAQGSGQSVSLEWTGR